MVKVSRSHTHAAFVRQLTATTILFLGAFRLSAESGKLDGLYYETKGAGDSVVLIHGGQMDRRMWDAQFGLFAKEYRVIRYDIRGFGKSDVPAKPYSETGDLHRLLQHLRVKKATFIGLSLGAAIAVDSDIHQILAKLAAEIPGAQKEVLPGAGHLVPMERPEDFNRLTLGFLTQRHPK